MTTAVATDLESIVRDNLALLGLSGTTTEPTIDCQCKVSAQRVRSVNASTAPSMTTGVSAVLPSLPTVQMETPLVQFTNAPPQPSVVANLPSQFQPGLKTLPSDVDLHPGIPGNEPFILPAGVTPEAIIEFQRVSAEQAYEDSLEKAKLKRLEEERFSQAAITKAEQEAAALAAKTASVLQSTSDVPVAVAVAVSPVTQEASANVGVLAPALKETFEPEKKEGFAPFPDNMDVAQGSFDASTVLLFLFVAFVVYKIRG